MQRQQSRRIQIDALPADSQMEMGAGGASRPAADSDLLAFLHRFPFFHAQFGEMEIESQQTLAVVENHAVAFKEQRAGEQDFAAVDGGYGCAGGDTEVEALVRALHRSVEDALHTEDVGDGCVYGRGEISFPFPLGANGPEDVGLDLFVLGDLA